MVSENFPKAYAYMQVDELGKDDDPEDRGGRTCDGVTQNEFDAWCALHSQPFSDVWDITEATKQAIFHIQYWNPWADRLPNAFDYLWFDVAVNSGHHQATLILQRALQLTPRQVDGAIGIFTVQRAIVYPDKRDLVERFIVEHKMVYDSIIRAHPTDSKYRKGWYNRIQHELTNAMAMLDAATIS